MTVQSEGISAVLTQSFRIFGKDPALQDNFSVSYIYKCTELYLLKTEANQSNKSIWTEQQIIKLNMLYTRIS